MLYNLKALQMTLNLFDAGAEGQGSAAPGDTTAAASTQQQTGVKASQQVEKEAASPEERSRAYRDLVEGEYKDLYTQDVQKHINRRFRETKVLQDQLGQYQPVIDMLMQRYNVSDIGGLQKAIDDDNAYWEAAADAAGMSIEQYKQFSKLQSQNAQLMRAQRQSETQRRAQQQLSKWKSEAEEVKKTYPKFDLERESQNPDFLSLLKSHVSMRQAYEVIHMDEIKSAISELQAKATEKKISENIKARGTRPDEAGASSSSAFKSASDVHKLTKAQRAEIARKVMRGETVTL